MSEFKDHFPVDIGQEILDYAIETVFLKQRYIFTERKGTFQRGYCTYCKQNFHIQGLKHKEWSVCPKCNSECEVRSSGRGRKYMVDRAYFVYYEKSLIDPEAIIARGFFAYRNISGDYREIETFLKLEAMYLFKPGQSIYFTKTWEYSWNFAEQKNVLSLMDREYRSYYCYCSEESIKKAVQGTLFQYSTWESFFNGDMVRFFDLVSKYPCIEYLSKLGLRVFVKAKLYGWRTYNAINWRGKSIDKVLRLSKQDMKEVLSVASFVEPLALRLFQIGKKDGSNFSLEEVRKMPYLSLEDLKRVLKYSSLRKAHAYMTKQNKKDSKRKHYLGLSQVLTIWRDYLQDCVTLEFDLNSEYVIYPPNLYQAHQNTIKQVKIKADKELDMKIAKRLTSLSKFNFEFNGLFIRPVESSQELIDEGKTLKHCVGTYADRYAKGETSLFVIREVSEPNKPFFTLEMKKGQIVQNRGLRNCNPTKEVQAFVDAFKSVKLSKQPKERKVAV